MSSEKRISLSETEARKTLVALFDASSFSELDAYATEDPNAAGVITGYGTVGGSTVFAFAQDISQNGGAIGKTAGKKICKVFDLALKTGAPVIGIYNSN